MLCLGAVALAGCVVRDRVTIVPRVHPPATVEPAEPERPDGGRIGINAVLTESQIASQTQPETAQPVEPAPQEAEMPDERVAESPNVEPNPGPTVDSEPAPAIEPDPVATADEDASEAPVVLDPPLHAAWGEGSDYNRLYRVDQAAATVSGEIDAVGTFIPAADASPGLLLDLRFGDEIVQVHAAPLRYLRAIAVRFDFGESLKVTGRWATVGGQRVLIAQSIVRGETVIELRDAQTGRPLWVDPIPAADDGEATESPESPPSD